jgi:hypothetical protein
MAQRFVDDGVFGESSGGRSQIDTNNTAPRGS